MAETTGIEWADATANFWIGCTKVSPACDFCYAERDWDHRYGRVQWGPHGDRSQVKAGAQVIRKVQRGVAAFIEEHRRRPRIFVNSLSDFADNHRSIDPAWRAEVWQLARECPDVILMILTKRPQNLPGYLPADWGDGYPNVWIGTTAETREHYLQRWRHLAAIPAVVRFVSAEPLLGDLGDLDLGMALPDWIIGGGESGPNARPTHPASAISLRDWSAQYGIPFLWKQWGEYGPYNGEPGVAGFWLDPNGSAYQGPTHWPPADDESRSYVIRWGKKAAGRLLDGVQHDGYPA